MRIDELETGKNQREIWRFFPVSARRRRPSASARRHGSGKGPAPLDLICGHFLEISNLLPTLATKQRYNLLAINKLHDGTTKLHGTPAWHATPRRSANPIQHTSSTFNKAGPWSYPNGAEREYATARADFQRLLLVCSLCEV